MKPDGNIGIGTTSLKSALHVVGLPVYANNAAAIAGGLTAGAFYRTGWESDSHSSRTCAEYSSSEAKYYF